VTQESEGSPEDAGEVDPEYQFAALLRAIPERDREEVLRALEEIVRKH
jgi:hypothetical protein